MAPVVNVFAGKWLSICVVTDALSHASHLAATGALQTFGRRENCNAGGY